MVLRKMAAMRAAKARRRLARLPVESEPQMVRYYPLEFGVRVKATGETHWRDFVSVRHAAKALALIRRYCPDGSKPGAAGR